MDEVRKPVFDAQFAYWRSLLAVALTAGFWLVPVVYMTVPDDFLAKDVLIAIATLSGGVAAFLAFFIGMSAGARLPR